MEPRFHPNIIGRRGATINKIRENHDVRIQLPDKEGANADQIMITGYEHLVKAAQEDILRIVQELVSIKQPNWTDWLNLFIVYLLHCLGVVTGSTSKSWY